MTNELPISNKKIYYKNETWQFFKLAKCNNLYNKTVNRRKETNKKKTDTRYYNADRIMECGKICDFQVGMVFNTLNDSDVTFV